MNSVKLSDLSTIPVSVWFILAILLLTQGILVYKDAEKRGENKWLWGLFALLNASNGLIYLFITRKMWRKLKKKT